MGSCLDTAAHLAARGWLEPWDSVQVYSQTAGRGQLRRQWHSPVGNLYAALASALLKLYEDNAATLTPDPLYARFYYSHPPAVERLAQLQRQESRV